MKVAIIDVFIISSIGESINCELWVNGWLSKTKTLCLSQWGDGVLEKEGNEMIRINIDLVCYSLQSSCSHITSLHLILGIALRLRRWAYFSSHFTHEQPEADLLRLAGCHLGTDIQDSWGQPWCFLHPSQDFKEGNVRYRIQRSCSHKCDAVEKAEFEVKEIWL